VHYGLQCFYLSFHKYIKKSPPERQPALEHIRNALQLNPTDAVAQFRQGLIERSR